MRSLDHIVRALYAPASTIKCLYFLLPFIHQVDLFECTLEWPFAVDYHHFHTHMRCKQKWYITGMSSQLFLAFLTHLKDVCAARENPSRPSAREERMGNINLIYFYYDEFHWGEEIKNYSIDGEQKQLQGLVIFHSTIASNL